jgi:hypothetical protein
MKTCIVTSAGFPPHSLRTLSPPLEGGVRGGSGEHIGMPSTSPSPRLFPTQLGRHPLEDFIPITPPRLSKQPHRRIPRAVGSP